MSHRPLPPRNCQWCGQVYSPKYPRQKYCSVKCTADVGRKAQGILAVQRREYEREHGKFCHHCGETKPISEFYDLGKCRCKRCVLRMQKPRAREYALRKYWATICTVSGCKNHSLGGMCGTHYKRQKLGYKPRPVRSGDCRLPGCQLPCKVFQYCTQHYKTLYSTFGRWAREVPEEIAFEFLKSKDRVRQVWRLVRRVKHKIGGAYGGQVEV